MLSRVKFIVRHLYRNRLISLISILGLSSGLATTIILSLYLFHHLTFDGFHAKSDRIWKVISKVTDPKGTTDAFGISFGVLKDDFENYKSVERVVRVFQGGNVEVDLEKERYNNVPLLFADYEFFRVFDFGVDNDAFNRPDQVIISSKFNERIFNGNGQGKNLRFNNKDYQVSAVVDLPLNTQFQFELLAPLQSTGLLEELGGSNSGMEFHTYVLMNSEASKDQINLLATHYNKLMNERWEGTYSGNNYLMPLQKTHLNGSTIISSLSSVNKQHLYIISIVALLVLILGLINYTNFQIAGAHQRKHEMGMKKILGASRVELFFQVLYESQLTVFFSGILALVLVYLFSTLINPEIIDPAIYHPSGWNMSHVAVFIVILLILGIFTGIYPAIHLSGKSKAEKETAVIHPSILSLVIIQFAVKASLIIGIVTIHLQLKMINEQPLGFDRENVVLIKNLKNIDIDQYHVIKANLEKYPDILSVGAFQSPPGWGNSGQFINLANREKEGRISVDHVRVIDSYVDLFGLEIVMGKDFDYDQVSEGQGFLLNETAYHALFPNGGDPIGIEIEMSGPRIGPIRGIIKDYHYESLHHNIGPIALNLENPYSKVLGIKLSGANTGQTLSRIEKEIMKIDPFYTLDYNFLDDVFENAYRSEYRTRSIIGYATLLIMILSVSGLYALSIFLINTRSKEVAIRKVLGANLFGIFWLLTSKIGTWMLVGAFLGITVAWYFTSYWLLDFTIRIDLWETYLYIIPLALLVIGTITLLSILRKLTQVMTIRPVD
ncbi:MAG: ABC transporter permease, partial [Cyclobacteriaceae bacterium]|nr:ABC transporter permease [Cyclobacteriaceae bacterium]